MSKSEFERRCAEFSALLPLAYRRHILWLLLAGWSVESTLWPDEIDRWRQRILTLLADPEDPPPQGP